MAGPGENVQLQQPLTDDHQIKQRVLVKIEQYIYSVIQKRLDDLTKTQSVKNQGLLVHVLSKLYELCQTNQRVTKRDLYYQDKELYGKQHVLDRMISLASKILQEPRRNFNILSTSKGLIYGDITFHCHNGATINCLSNEAGSSLSCFLEDIGNIESPTTKIILVIEKDASFQKLLDENFRTKYGRHCLILTGKGYPDIGTRIILKRLQTLFEVPVVCLTDSGAYGIEIMLTYKYGGLGKDTPYESEEIAVPTLEWIGVFTSDIGRWLIPQEKQQSLNERELRKVDKLLRRNFVQNDVVLDSELRDLKRVQKKVEIQALEECGQNFLSNYVCNRLNSVLEVHGIELLT